MKNKQRYILCKETTNNERKKIEEICKKADMEVVNEEKCNVQYEVKSTVIYAVDGSLVQYDKEQGRILFVQSYPHFKSKSSNEKKEKIYGKILCEIRMPATQFKLMSNAIVDEISDYEKHEAKKAPLIEFLKNKNDQLMFG